MSTYKNIIFEISDQVAWLKFNRSGQLNAMNTLMMEEIIDALKQIDVVDNELVKIAVITGEGKAFMAGADIKEYAVQTREQFREFQRKGREIYSLIEENSKPVIAAINGYAFGGGLEIALACDMIVAAKGAKMGLPEILLNLIPGGGGTLRLAKKIGVNRTNEIVMSGETFLAEQFYEYGVINQLYTAENFIEEVEKYAMRFSDKKGENLSIIKKLTQLSVGKILPETVDIEFNALNDFYEEDAAQEKIQEFYLKSQNRKK